MKRLLCLRHTHRVDVLTDMEPGLWLRRFQLLDTEVTEVSWWKVMFALSL
jgi:hypothetical protein